MNNPVNSTVTPIAAPDGSDRAVAQAINEHFGRTDCDLNHEPSRGLVHIIANYRRCVERETNRRAEARFLEQCRNAMRN